MYDWSQVKIISLEAFLRRIFKKQNWSFPISWYCKLDTRIHKPKVYPELQMQEMLQVDLLLRPGNLTDLVPAWHGVPSQ